jgi:hypothetical protein
MDAKKTANAQGQLLIMARSTVNSVTGCWRWLGGGRGLGYGAIKVGGRVIDAHRYSWLVFRGSIPNGKQVLHRCDNRSCVNPEHLEIGDAAKNRVDAITRGAFDGKAAAAARRQPITGEQLSQVLHDYDGGVSVRQLAVAHNVPPTTLRRLLKREGRTLPQEGGAS